MTLFYYIESDDGFWSNDLGWCDDRELASLFTKSETLELTLPIGSNVRWVLC